MNAARVLAFLASALVAGVCAHPFAVQVREQLVSGADPSSVIGSAPLAKLRASLPNAARPLRVLFVGNSLTSYNAMTSMVAQLAAAAGEPRPLELTLETVGGSGLLEHEKRGKVQQQLAGKRFDYVVLQDQGQRPGIPSRREKEMVVPIGKLRAAIVATGARPLLYETFARREGDFENTPGDTYEAMQDRIDDGYEQVGNELAIPVVPIGRIWRQALRDQPQLELYASDGLHPSRAGSYLVACAMLVQLYGRDPVGNPYLAGLAPDVAVAIQKSVAAGMSAKKLDL